MCGQRVHVSGKTYAKKNLMPVVTSKLWVVFGVGGVYLPDDHILFMLEAAFQCAAGS